MMFKKLRKMDSLHTEMVSIFLKLVLNIGKVIIRVVYVNLPSQVLKNPNQEQNQANPNPVFLMLNYRRLFHTKIGLI